MEDTNYTHLYNMYVDKYLQCLVLIIGYHVSSQHVCKYFLSPSEIIIPLQSIKRFSFYSEITKTKDNNLRMTYHFAKGFSALRAFLLK